MIPDNDLQDRFTYHAPPGPARVAAHVSIREAGLEMASYINDSVPDSREKSLAITKIEEAVFWANAALARLGAIGEPQVDDE